MSADAWQVCPKCTRKQKERFATEDRDLRDAYGKMDVDSWLARKAVLNQEHSIELEETLRLDYESYLEDPPSLDFHVYFCAGCTVCDWTFQYEHNETVKL